MLRHEKSRSPGAWIGPELILFRFAAIQPSFDFALAAIDMYQEKRRVIGILWMHDQAVIWFAYRSNFQITNVAGLWCATCVVPKSIQCFRQGEFSDRPLNRYLPGVVIRCPVSGRAIVLHCRNAAHDADDGGLHDLAVRQLDATPR